MLHRILAKTTVKTTAWHLRGHPHGSRPKKIKEFKKKKLISKDQEIQDTTIKKKLPTYLVPELFAALKVGCRIENKLRHFIRPFKRVPWFLVLQNASLTIQRSDSTRTHSMGINNHASRCMANAPHLFEDHHLTNNVGEVNRIGDGLAIKGEKMFKFSIEEDNGNIHTIKIPNSLYLPHHNIWVR